MSETAKTRGPADPIETLHIGSEFFTGITIEKNDGTYVGIISTWFAENARRDAKDIVERVNSYDPMRKALVEALAFVKNGPTATKPVGHYKTTIEAALALTKEKKS